MNALTQGRNTPRRERDIESHPVKGGVTIFAGALAMLDAAGFAVPASEAANLTALGRAEADATAESDGDAQVTTRRGVFQYANSGGADAITRASIGDLAFAVDDQTVAKTDNAGARSPAGTIRDVDAKGVWVEI